MDAQLPLAQSGAADASRGPRPHHAFELELKLLAPEGSLDGLWESPIIARHPRNGSVSRPLESTYYDTPDRILSNVGMSLRVRRNGKRYFQTLKCAPVPGQPFLRREWETTVSSATPDLTLLPVAEFGAPLDALSADTLDPIFTTKVRRRIQRLELPGAVIEIALDDGTIEAGDRSEKIAEVELELKAGNACALYDLGMQLLEVVPLKIGTQSKADRGYNLAFGTPAKATKAIAPQINAEHTIDDVIAILISACQQHVLANQTVADCGGDPEGVHQMRVGLRRLRTACTILGREVGSPTLKAFALEARWLARALGGPRDWDVLIADILDRPARALHTDIDFDGLREAAEPHRIAAYSGSQAALANVRYNRFHLSLIRWIESRGWRNELQSKPLAALLEPAPVFAARVLARLHRQALKRGSHFQELRPEGRHQLRIALKKLRYAAEFFQGLYGESAKAKCYLGELAKLQNVLGHANDATTTRPLLSIIANDIATPRVQRAIGVVIGWQGRDRIEVDKTLHKRWRQFKAMPTFWF